MKKRIIILSLICCLAVSGTVEASQNDGRINCGVESVGNPEWLGSTAAVYKVEEDGSIGEFIGYYPIADTGYGHSIPVSGYKSEIIRGKNIGTVETGLTLDFRQKSYTECKRWMVETYTGHGSTGSEVYVQIIKGVG